MIMTSHLFGIGNAATVKMKPSHTKQHGHYNAVTQQNRPITVFALLCNNTLNVKYEYCVHLFNFAIQDMLLYHFSIF